MTTMSRWNCKAMEELAVILTKIGEMEGARLALKEQLRTLPSRMARELSTPGERLEAARYLYWHILDLTAKDIKEGLLGTDEHSLMKLIGPTTIELLCDRCEEPMEWRSRRHMQSILL